MIKNNRN